MRKVRQALKDNTARPIFIETISGKGYRFCGSIVSGHSPEANGSGALEPEPSIQPPILPDPAPPPSPKTGGRSAAAEQVAGAAPTEEAERGTVWRRKLTIAAFAAASSLL